MTATVQCPDCHSHVHPRLWHYKSALPFRYLKTQHLCPICGVCMYESGGQFHWAGHLWLFIVLLPVTVLCNHFNWHGKWVSLAVAAYIGYLSWKVAVAAYRTLCAASRQILASWRRIRRR